jgi:hypothetical protein
VLCGDRLVRPRVKGNDKISKDDIGAWQLMAIVNLCGVVTHGVSSDDASLHASKSVRAHIDSRCTNGFLKCGSNSMKKLLG